RFERPNRPEWHDYAERIVLANTPFAFLFGDSVVTEQTGMVLILVPGLRQIFLEDLVRNTLVCPNLAMRMRAACTHKIAAVFENLNIVNEASRCKFLELI